MKKYKLVQIVNAHSVIKKLDEYLATIEDHEAHNIGVELLLNLANLQRVLRLEVVDYEKQQQRLLEKYAKPRQGQDETVPGMVDYEILNQEKFVKYINVLQQYDVQLDNVTLLKKDNLINLKTTNLSITDIELLLPFIDSEYESFQEEQNRKPIELTIEED